MSLRNLDAHLMGQVQVLDEDIILGSFQFLRFSPWFLQKTPGNLVFLTEKALDLVLGLVFTF